MTPVYTVTISIEDTDTFAIDAINYGAYEGFFTVTEYITNKIKLFPINRILEITIVERK